MSLAFLIASLAVLIAVAWFDARRGHIHDGAVLVLIALAAASRLIDGSFSVGGALVGFVVFGALWLPRRGRYLGAGDIGLGVAAGLLCGTAGAMGFAVLCAFIIGAITAAIGLVMGRLHHSDHIPFAPLLAAGVIVSLSSWNHAAAWLAARGW